MKIEIDTAQPLSASDKAVLLALLGTPTRSDWQLAVETTLTPNEVAGPETPNEVAGPEKPKRASRKPKAEPADEPKAEPADEPKAEPEEASDPEPAPQSVTREDVAKRAIQLIESGEKARVAEVLAELGVAKVRYLDDDQIAVAYEQLA